MCHIKFLIGSDNFTKSAAPLRHNTSRERRLSILLLILFLVGLAVQLKLIHRTLMCSQYADAHIYYLTTINMLINVFHCLFSFVVPVPTFKKPICCQSFAIIAAPAWQEKQYIHIYLEENDIDFIQNAQIKNVLYLRSRRTQSMHTMDGILFQSANRMPVKWLLSHPRRNWSIDLKIREMSMINCLWKLRSNSSIKRNFRI